MLGYYFSGDLDRDEGIVSYNWKNRLSGRANLTFQPSEKFGIDFGLGFSGASTARAGRFSRSRSGPLGLSDPGCEPGRNLLTASTAPFGAI